jgi:FSR family fosmidomycin resistance protein-like MFS transporter
MHTLFRQRSFLAVTAGHFGVDVLNGIAPVLLAALATPLALSNARIGLALTIYTLASALSQPLFGWLADRSERRVNSVLLAGCGVAWMALCYALIALTASWTTLLPCFLLAALGSGLFHPIGTATAAAAHPTRAGSATSIFFFCGQIGLALGPALGGLLLRSSGSLGILPLSGLALVPAALLLTAPKLAPASRAPRSRSAAHGAGGAWLATIAAFVALVALRSSIQAAYTAFLPKLFADRSWDSAAYGALAGSFMLAAAFGNVITGEIADRMGMRMAAVLPLLLSVPAGLVCLWAPTPLTAFVACGLAGLLIGGQHSVLVVHAQRLIPTQQGFASGLILGFTFASGAIGTWLAGIAADRVGLLLVLQVITLLGLPAALLALTLPGRAALKPASVSVSAEA